MRNIKLERTDDVGGIQDFVIEYIDESHFNAYLRDEQNFLVPVILDAQIEMGRNVPDELIVRTESE